LRKSLINCIISSGRARVAPETLVPDKFALSTYNSGDTIRRCYHDKYKLKIYLYFKKTSMPGKTFKGRQN